MTPVTTVTMTRNTCMSSGYIVDKAKKEKERLEIAEQTKIFYAKQEAANAKNSN